MCILCQQTSPKRWFGNRAMTSNCDVTISAHQIKMTTLCHWMNPLMKIFCVRHWQQRNAQSKEFTSRLQQRVEREGWSQPALLVINAFFSRCDVRTWFGVLWSWGLIQLFAEKKICLICVAARIPTYFLVHLDLYRSKGLLTKPSFDAVVCWRANMLEAIAMQCSAGVGHSVFWLTRLKWSDFAAWFERLLVCVWC